MLHHESSTKLFNAAMKPVAQVRRERLEQLKAETGLTYADMNERLGRNRRDSTLSQIATAAPNTRTGRPRQMGDDQARAIERAFNKPEGWFDTDEADPAPPEPSEAALPLHHARENTSSYLVWPFPRVPLAAILKLPESQRHRLEATLLGAMAMLESEPHAPAPSNGTTG